MNKVLILAIAMVLLYLAGTRKLYPMIKLILLDTSQLKTSAAPNKR